MSPPSSHLSFETLLDYWLQETDAAATEAIDEHLMQCDACGVAFDELVALAGGVVAVWNRSHSKSPWASGIGLV